MIKRYQIIQTHVQSAFLMMPAPQAAEEGKMDPLVGRAAELERTIQILARRQKNNPAPWAMSGTGWSVGWWVDHGRP